MPYEARLAKLQNESARNESSQRLLAQSSQEYFELIRSYILRRDYLKASAVYNNAMTMTSNPYLKRDLTIRLTNLFFNDLVESYGSKAEYDKGVADLTCVITMLSQYKENAKEKAEIISKLHFKRGLLHTNARELDLADKDFTFTINSGAVSKQIMMDAYIDRGRVYSVQGKYADALRDFASAAKYGSCDSIFYNMGVVYDKIGNHKQALLNFERALKLDKNSADAYLMCGKVCCKMGKTLKAKSYLEKAIKKDKHCDDAYSSLAALYFDEGRMAKAGDICQEALKINPKNSKAYIITLKVCDKCKQKKLLLKFAKQYVAELENDADAQFYLGFGYQENLDYENAIKAYKKTVELEPDCTAAYHNLGAIYGKLNKHQELIDIFSKMLNIKTQSYPEPASFYENSIKLAKQELEKQIAKQKQIAEQELNSPLAQRLKAQLTQELKAQLAQELQKQHAEQNLKNPGYSSARNQSATVNAPPTREPCNYPTFANKHGAQPVQIRSSMIAFEPSEHSTPVDPNFSTIPII